MQDLIRRMVADDQFSSSGRKGAAKVGSTNLYISALPNALQSEQYDGVVFCSDKSPPSAGQESRHERKTKILHFLCCEGKIGSRNLRFYFPKLTPFIAALPRHDGAPKILFACSTGQDLSVGVALATLCSFFDENCESPSRPHISAL